MNIGYVVYGFPKKSETWIPLEIQELEKRGHKVNIFDVSKEIDYNLLRQQEFLICHWAISGLHAMRWGIPFSITCHAYDIWKDNGRVLLQVSKSKNCKFVGCITEYHKNKYKEWGIEKPLFITPVCCDIEGLYKKREFLGDLIVTGGRNKDKKGFKYAAEGFPFIHMFGNESLKEYKEISPTITCHNWLPKEDLRALLDDCWLFVSPNVTGPDGDMDGQCTTIKEALLMELQVLTTDIAGNSEYKHVYFSNPQDIAKGAKGEVYQKIIKERNTRGRQYVIDTFSPKVCIDSYLKAIEEVT